MSRDWKLTTTSHAILGLLAIRPWTSYELTQQMQRSLRRFWPRAESKLYEEPKKLTDHGLAHAMTEQVGKRSRTVYSVTPAGREALAQWLAQPGEGPALEFEQMLKVFFAEYGTKQDLLTTISHIQAWAEQRATDDADIARHYLDGQGQFPERTPQLVLVGRYSADFAEMTRRWAQWATEVVKDWPEKVSEAKAHWQTLEHIASSNSPPEGPRDVEAE